MIQNEIVYESKHVTGIVTETNVILVAGETKDGKGVVVTTEKGIHTHYEITVL